MNNLTRSLLLEARMEFLRLLRNPAFAVPVLAFPLMFYLLFGVMAINPREAGAVEGARQVLATLMVFGIMAPGLFGLGVTVAMDRERGLLELKRALPMPTSAYLGAKLIMAVLFATIVAALMMVFAAVAGQVNLAAAQWVALFTVTVMGVLPFCALGLWIGTLVPGQGASAVVNLIYLPMSFVSGLWIPLSSLPHTLARLAPLWPPYHLQQLSLAVVGQEHSGSSIHVISLIGMAVVFFALARWQLAKAR